MEVIRAVIVLVIGMILGYVAGKSFSNNRMKKAIASKQFFANKHLQLYRLTIDWLALYQGKKTLIPFFQDNEFRTIAIYGMSYLGERLLEELADSGIEVKYVIDKNKEKIKGEVPIYSMEDDIPEVDAIIITAVTYYNEIEEELMKVTDVPIISLEDVIRDIQQSEENER